MPNSPPLICASYTTSHGPCRTEYTQPDNAAHTSILPIPTEDASKITTGVNITDLSQNDFYQAREKVVWLPQRGCYPNYARGVLTHSLLRPTARRASRRGGSKVTVTPIRRTAGRISTIVFNSSNTSGASTHCS